MQEKSTLIVIISYMIKVLTHQSTQEGISLTANTHTSEAAQDKHQTTFHETKGGGQVGVSTKTGSDITVAIKGEGQTTDNALMETKG